MVKKLALPVENRREYVEPEITGLHYGEYESEDPHSDMFYNNYLSYEGYIEYKETDEVLLE